jgi:hypothetical protein
MLGLAASLMPAKAACSPRLMFTTTADNQSYFYTPGNPFGAAQPGVLLGGGSTTYYLNGFFWSFGGGNPVVGLGNDNGANKGNYYSNWLHPRAPSTGPAFVGGGSGHWAYPGTDGCIDFDGSNGNHTTAGLPDVNECNIIVLNDLQGDNAYFGVFAVAPNPNNALNFEYTTVTGFPNPLNLAVLPKPQVISSTPFGGGQVSMTVRVDPGPLTPANGFYLHCSPAQNAAILTGWRLYTRSVPTGAPKPSSPTGRALDQSTDGTFPNFPASAPILPPWVLNGGTHPIGVDASITVPCNDDNDFFMCATLTFGGASNITGAADWELKFCSMNSTRVQCGPNLADPHPKPGFHRIERPAQKGTR